MKSYFYYTRESIENFKVKRQLSLMGQEDKILSVEEMEEQGKTELYKNCIIYESGIPFVGYPILENEKLRQATLVELIDLGEQQLLAGEIINREEGIIETIPQPSWQYYWDFEQFKWVIDENTLQDGQYIDGDNIVDVPYTDNFLIPKWNKEIHIWEEGATKDEFIETRKNKILEYTELEKQKKALETSKFSSEDEILIIIDKMKILEQEINNLALKINSLKD